jgi:lysine 2,3-aminomutase
MHDSPVSSPDRPPPAPGWTEPEPTSSKSDGEPPEPKARRPRVERFPIGAASQRLRARAYPTATEAEWTDWKWQLRNRLRNEEQLARVFQLSAGERSATVQSREGLPVGITPYYAALMAEDDALEPLRRTHIQVPEEHTWTVGEERDPLHEDESSPVPGLVHRYPDRVLFLVTGHCATYCRYCTRSRMVGNPTEYSFGARRWDAALAYIEAHPEIRDVLLSGGDALTLSDDQLDWLLGRLGQIRHLDFIRIGTKVPVVLPMRVTRALVRVLRRHKPWLSLHFTHPAELTPEVTEAAARLADAGLPLGSQTVLLAGVNDEVETLRTLFHGLLKRRIRPYYLYQCDPIQGSAHFRTPVHCGVEIIQALRGHTTGYAVPTFVVDAPGGGGKIVLAPEVVVGREGDSLLLRGYSGGVFRYPDPGGTLGAT